MSIRRQIYDLLRSLPPSQYTAHRIASVAAYLDSLPPEKVPAAERRLLAFNQAYKALVEGGEKGTIEEFFESVDAMEQGLIS